MELLTQGYSDEQIATKLSISAATVKTQLSMIRIKLKTRYGNRVLLAFRYRAHYPDPASSGEPLPAADPLWGLIRNRVLAGTARDAVALLLSCLYEQRTDTAWLAQQMRRSPSFVSDLIEHGKALERRLRHCTHTQTEPSGHAPQLRD